MTLEQTGFPKDLFEKLDATKSGSLTPKELTRWLVYYPDAELVVPGPQSRQFAGGSCNGGGRKSKTGFPRSENGRKRLGRVARRHPNDACPS